MQLVPSVNISDVKAWINRDLKGQSGRFVRDIYEGVDPHTFDIEYRFAFYTATNEYRIHARIEGSYDDTCSYLGCTVTPRQNLPGEDHRRSVDLMGGFLTEQTWTRILAGIVRNELMQLAIDTSGPKRKWAEIKDELMDGMPKTVTNTSGPQSVTTFNHTLTDVLNTPVSLGVTPLDMKTLREVVDLRQKSFDANYNIVSSEPMRKPNIGYLKDDKFEPMMVEVTINYDNVNVGQEIPNLGKSELKEIARNTNAMIAKQLDEDIYVEKLAKRVGQSKETTIGVVVTEPSSWAKPGVPIEAPVGFNTRYGYVENMSLRFPYDETENTVARNITR